MEEENVLSLEPSTAPTRRRWLIAAAAAVLALAVGLAVLAVIRNTPTPTIPVIGTADDPAAAEAITVVDAAFAAYNAGDLEAWSLARDPGSANFTGEPYERGLTHYAAMHAAGDRWAVAQCEAAGLGEWENLTDSGDVVTGYRFTCEATGTNSFHGAAGITLVEAIDFVVVDGAVVAAKSEGNFQELWLFNQHFRQWLDSRHPEVANTVEYSDLSGFPVAEDVPTALEYVDEFIAESQRWGPAG